MLNLVQRTLQGVSSSQNIMPSKMTTPDMFVISRATQLCCRVPANGMSVLSMSWLSALVQLGWELPNVFINWYVYRISEGYCHADTPAGWSFMDDHRQ